MQVNVMQWKSTKGAISDVLASRGRWLRRQRHIKVAFLAVPTPILMHHEEVWSPNRTNYFPSAQILLASGLQARLRK